jgi:hypothetical protein
LWSTLLCPAESALLESIAHNVPNPIIRANLFKQSLVGNIARAYSVAPVLQFRDDLSFGVGQNIGIFLKDLNDLIGGKICVLLLRLLLLLRTCSSGQEQA